MTIASHAEGRRFNPCTAQSAHHENHASVDGGAFALIHNHLINIASLGELSSRQREAFFCLGKKCSKADKPLSHGFYPDGADQHGGEVLKGGAL